MVTLTAPGMNYACNFPTRIEEYTKDNLQELVKHINLPKFYAVVALLSPLDIVRLSFNVSNNKQEGTTSVLPVICKWNDPDNNLHDIMTGDIVTVNKSDIELGTELAIPCACSFNKLVQVLNSNKQLRDNIVKNECHIKDDKGNPMREVIVATFKIIPVSTIKAYYGIDEEIKDPFKSLLPEC